MQSPTTPTTPAEPELVDGFRYLRFIDPATMTPELIAVALAKDGSGKRH